LNCIYDSSLSCWAGALVRLQTAQRSDKLFTNL
jgi:hypothetical protein